LEKAVLAKGLSKTYRVSVRTGLLGSRPAAIRALDRVSLEVAKGECFGLIGPNGAGKTTLVKILTTLLLPDSGEAWVNGFNVVRGSERVLRSIGVMLTGERTLYWKLTGRENLLFFGRLQDVGEDELGMRIDGLCERFGLTGFIDRLVETYSTGQRILTSFCKALVNNPQTIFLDEPTLSLDPVHAAEIRKAILGLTREEGRTVILTTQLMHEADALCDRVAMLNAGRVVALGSPGELKRTLGGGATVTIECDPQPGAAELGEALGLKGLLIQEEGGLRICFRALDEEMLPRVLRGLVSRGFSVRRVDVAEPSLEDVFNRLVGGGG